MISYIGNAHYCYANSAAMLLSSIGEWVDPSVIEVLSGTSLGAIYDRQKESFYFNHPALPPDLGITKALGLLGFECMVRVSDGPEDFPREALEKDLAIGPAVLGPVEQFYLAYNPNHEHLRGADHYLLAYQLEGENCYLHDPAGFPHVFLDLANLKKAWRGEGVVGYARGYYRYITHPRRAATPTDEEINQAALEYFREIYRQADEIAGQGVLLTGGEAIGAFAAVVRNGEIPPEKVGFLKNFLFQLGAKRANDYALFFSGLERQLAGIKAEQAQLHGWCHTYVGQEDWLALAECLDQLAETEEEFRQAFFS